MFKWVSDFICRIVLRQEIFFEWFCLICLVIGDFTLMSKKHVKRDEIEDKVMWMPRSSTLYFFFVFVLTEISNLSSLCCFPSGCLDHWSQPWNWYGNLLLINKIWLLAITEFVYLFIAVCLMEINYSGYSNDGFCNY